MSTITTINATDVIGNSRSTINTNFANLNADKLESVAESNLNFTDITTGDVSTSKHGLVPKAPNDTGKYLRGDGTWAGGTAGIAVYSASGATLSLTTTANQKVVVWAKGELDIGTGGGTRTINLKYNSVVKDSVIGRDNSSTPSILMPFALMYTETPGAGTHDITVDGATVTDVVIIAMVF